MSINLINLLREMNTMTRSCYEDYPDGTTGLKMPTFDDLEEFDTQADQAYDEWQAKDVNKEES